MRAQARKSITALSIHKKPENKGHSPDFIHRLGCTTVFNITVQCPLKRTQHKIALLVPSIMSGSEARKMIAVLVPSSMSGSEARKIAVLVPSSMSGSEAQKHG